MNKNARCSSLIARTLFMTALLSFTSYAKADLTINPTDWVYVGTDPGDSTYPFDAFQYGYGSNGIYGYMEVRTGAPPTFDSTGVHFILSKAITQTNGDTQHISVSAVQNEGFGNNPVHVRVTLDADMAWIACSSGSTTLTQGYGRPGTNVLEDVSGEGILCQNTTFDTPDYKTRDLPVTITKFELISGPVTNPTPTPSPSPSPTATPAPTPSPTPIVPKPPTSALPPAQNQKDQQQPVPQCTSGASTIYIDNLAVSESIGIVGAPFSLEYMSDRQSGRTDYNTAIISLVNGDPSGISQVNLKISYAGRVFNQNFSPSAFATYKFYFDGKDSAGNLVPAAIIATIKISYLYTDGTTDSSSYTKSIGKFQARSMGLGGWTASNNHFYDVNGKVLYTGDGAAYPVTAMSYKGALLISSRDGSEAYLFNTAGYHLQTRDTLTGAVKMNFAYDGQGRLASETDSFGNKTTILHNGTIPTQIVSPYGQITKLSVDQNGYLEAVTDPMNHSYSLVTNADGLLTKITHPNGHNGYMSYDSIGRLAKDYSDSGFSKTFSASVQNGFDVIQSFTALNRKTTYSSIVNSGTTTRVTNNPDGSSLSDIESARSADYTDSTETYSGTSSQDDARFGAMSPLQTESYSELLGTPYSVTSDTTQSVVLNGGDVLDLVSEAITTTLNDQSVYESRYDGQTKTLVQTSPEGVATSRVFDANGLTKTIATPGLLPVNMSYDARGRLTKVVNGNRTETLSYDSLGRLSSTKNALGLVTGRSYDSAGRVTQITQPDGKSIKYAYDASGNLLSITTPNAFVHQFAVNLDDNLSSYLPPLLNKISTGATLYSYNADRQITQMTKPDGTMLVYSYDPASGNLNSVSSGSQRRSVTYQSPSNQIATVLTSDGVSVSYAYEGHMTKSESTNSPLGSISLNLYHQPDMKLSAIGINSESGLAKQIAYTYDLDSRIISAGNETLGYDKQDGLRTDVKLGKVNETLSYSSYGEEASDSFKNGAASLYSAVFTRNALGQITSKTESYAGRKVSFSFSYDSMSRLASEKIDGLPVVSYSYDANGNRLSTKGLLGLGTSREQYNEQDQLVKFGNTVYSYDKMGNRIGKSVPAGKNRSEKTAYVYDVFGNLKSVTLPDGRQIDYVIDGLGRRIGKKINGKLVQGFIYQSQYQIAAETDGNGAIVKRFVYGSRPNVPDYTITSAGTYRLITDQVGSLRMVIDTSNGKIVDEALSTAFGELSVDAHQSSTPFGFAGGLYDRDTKLTHFGAREYDAEVGRWISKDPTLFGGGDTNLYGYSVNDPVNKIDPDGNSWLGVGLGIVIGGINAYSNYQSASHVSGASSDQIVASTIAGFVTGFASGFGSAYGLGGSIIGNTLGAAGNNYLNQKIFARCDQGIDYGRVGSAAVLGFATGLGTGLIPGGIPQATNFFGEDGIKVIGAPFNLFGFSADNGIPSN